MRWPATFGPERIELIQDLSRLTGHAEEDLCRALRGVPVTDVWAFAHGSTHPKLRGELEQRVKEARR